MKHEEITDKIIKAFYKVYNTLGYGFLEKVYERAMLIELKQMGLNTESQSKILVYYYGNIIGDYCSDLTVENVVICELKAAECIVEEHEFQLINYLKATTIEVGLLLNFGKKPEIRRKIFDNDRKPLLKKLFE
jgi:GxxExxY protein